MGLKDGMRSGRGGAALPGGIRWFELLQSETITANVVSDSGWDERVLDCAELEELGPALLDMATHMEMRGRTGQFEARLVLQYKYEDGSWSTPGGSDVLLATVSSDGYPDPAVFSDRARLGRRRIRVVLQFRTKSTGGGAIGDRATLSVGVACRPFCC